MKAILNLILNIVGFICVAVTAVFIVCLGVVLSLASGGIIVATIIVITILASVIVPIYNFFNKDNPIGEEPKKCEPLLPEADRK